MKREKESIIRIPIKKIICITLDKIQEEHSKLFDDLILLKNFNSEKFHSNIIYEFQYKLASSLYRLATIRNEIIAAEKNLIQRKNSLNGRWFISKMKLFKALKGGIDNSITIGKSLGDAFVWHFYQLNLKELFGNLEYPEVNIFPTGIGGIGELKFIKTHFVLNEHFVILHGISNLLRVGDVSFFSLKDGRLTSIGEIKTKEVEKNKINISVTVLNTSSRDFLNGRALDHVEITESIDYKDYFDPARFERQIDKTSDFLKSQIHKSDKIDKIIYDKYYAQELEEVVEGLKRKDLNIKRVSDSILFAANKLPTKKISKRIFLKHDASKLKKYEEEIEKDVLSILSTEKPNYPLRFGSIHFDSHFKTNFLIGVSPLFWYPVKPSVLKKLYFQEIFVVTLFNPTNFYSALNEIGIEVIKDDTTGKFFVGKKLNKGVMKLEYFNYFYLLIENNLHTPEAVISMVKEMVSQVERHEGLHYGAKIQTEILHLFTHYNQDNIS